MTVSGRCTDQPCTTDVHISDRVYEIVNGVQFFRHELVGQAALVNHHDDTCVVFPNRSEMFAVDVHR